MINTEVTLKMHKINQKGLAIMIKAPKGKVAFLTMVSKALRVGLIVTLPQMATRSTKANPRTNGAVLNKLECLRVGARTVAFARQRSKCSSDLRTSLPGGSNNSVGSSPAKDREFFLKFDLKYFPLVKCLVIHHWPIGVKLVLI
jgi:hypothetical protein